MLIKVIFFSQPLLPEGLKLEIESCITCNQHYIPQGYSEFEAWAKFNWKTGDSIIVVTDSIWTRYRVL